jgi:hypothetical protein
MVLIEDGSLAAIKHLPVTTPTKTLGQMTTLTGSSNGAIVQMNKKAQGWIDQAKSSKLHKQNLWFLLDKQFWPRVAFGISSIIAPFEVLEECLMKKYFELLSICGICKSVSRDIRQMDRGFYGIGFPHPGMECLVAQINKLLTHYGSSLGLGLHMQTSMELMVTEGGTSTQTLAEPFARYSKWVTYCWLRSVWEKVDMFCLWTEVSELPLGLTREQDKWIMKVFVECEFTDDKLLRLNQVRCNQQVIFYSNMFDVGGNALDRRYLERRLPGAMWSTFIFPQESPPAKDFRLWLQALCLIAPRGWPQQQLGKFVSKGHKIWEWRFDLKNSRLYHTRGSVMDIYTPLLVPGHTRRANQ